MTKRKGGAEQLREKKKMLKAGAAKSFKMTDFSLGAAATSTSTSGDSSEDAGGSGTSTDMGEHETDSRDEGKSKTESKPVQPESPSKGGC